MENVFIAVGPYCFGRGKTQIGAVKLAAKNLPSYCNKQTVVYQVFEAHPDTEVTEMGGLRYPVKHKPRTVAVYNHKLKVIKRDTEAA